MKKCGMCGSRNLKLENIKGTFHPWKEYTKVELIVDQEVLVCQECSNQILGSNDIVILEKNLVKSLQEKTGRAIKTLISSYGLNQGQIAAALGLTPQYVSSLKHKKKILSFTAFNLLQSYVESPQLITKLTGIQAWLKIDVIRMPDNASDIARPEGHWTVTEVSKETLKKPQGTSVGFKYNGVQNYGIKH